MKITIFPEVTAKPDASNKALEASKALYGEILELTNIQELNYKIQSNAWSPSVFEGNERLGRNFIAADFIALDIDDGLTLKEAYSIISNLGYEFIIGTSVSHGKEKNGIKADRFRLIFPLQNTINRIEDFKATIKSFEEIILFDKACVDPARFFFACKESCHVPGYRKVKTIKGVSIVKNVTKIDTNEKGELSTRTKMFIENGAEEGTWHIEFLFACRDLVAQNYTYDESFKILQQITGTLDEKHDINQLKYAYNNNSVKFDYRRKNG